MKRRFKCACGTEGMREEAGMVAPFSCDNCTQRRYQKREIPPDPLFGDSSLNKGPAPCGKDTPFATPMEVNGFLCPTHGIRHQMERCDKCDDIGRQIGEIDIRLEAQLISGDVTRRDLLMFHKQICEEAFHLMENKNHDYAADTDPFRNFKICADCSGVTVEQVFLQYLAQKMARLRSFVEQGKLKVKNESLRDTILDLTNYAVLFYGWCVQVGYFKEQK